MKKPAKLYQVHLRPTKTEPQPKTVNVVADKFHVDSRGALIFQTANSSYDGRCVAAFAANTWTKCIALE